MLGELFPNVFTSGANDVTTLNSGGNPTKLLGTEKANLKAAMVLPAKGTQEQVKAAAKACGELEGQAPILKELSEYQIRQQDAALQILDTRVQHHEKSMKNEQRFQKQISKHGQNVLDHNLTTTATQAHFSGYEAQFQAAADTVKF